MLARIAEQQLNTITQTTCLLMSYGGYLPGQGWPSWPKALQNSPNRTCCQLLVRKGGLEPPRFYPPAEILSKRSASKDLFTFNNADHRDFSLRSECRLVVGIPR